METEHRGVTGLRVDPQKKPVAEAVAAIREAARGMGEDATKAYLIAESYSEILFEPWSSSNANGDRLEEFFSGRIFDRNLEVRWERDGDQIHIWTIQEDPTADMRVERVLRRDGDGPSHRIRYYLWGEIDFNGRDWDGTFREPRIQCVRKHPVEPPAQAGKYRAYIEVEEYRPAEPESISDHEELADQLNQAPVIAHRFVGVGVERTE